MFVEEVVDCVEGEVEWREPKRPVRRVEVAGTGDTSCRERREGEEEEAVEVVSWWKRGILREYLDKAGGR